MPVALSYPGLRCVLEHLEAVKRAHIVAHSPGLQKVDKLIPLCLENLHIQRQELTINKLLIEFDKGEVKFDINEKTFSRKILESPEDSIKKLLHFYVCGRSITRVDRLDWGYSLLPDHAMFRVNCLKALFGEDFDTVLPFIDTLSFPLKTVVTIPETSNLDIQVVKSAATLVLHFVPLVLYFIIDRLVTVEDLKKLNNTTVVFQNLWSLSNDIIPLIKYQIETRKATGTTFVISVKNKDFINKMLRKFELTFGEYRNDLDDVKERFLPGSSKFSIPINNKSRIYVYAIEASQDGCYKIIVKPVSEVSGL